MVKVTQTGMSNAFKPTFPDTKYLWHLMSKDVVTKLTTLLRGGMWFARLDTFDDDQEGCLPDGNVHLLSKLPKFQVSMVKGIYEQAIRQSFASCWHMSDEDPNDHVWAEFGGGGNGIAVRTTPMILKDALADISGPDGPVHIGVVRYIDHWVDVIPESNVIEAAFVVQDGYSEEREARLLIHTVGNCVSEYLVPKKGLDKMLVERPPAPHGIAGNTSLQGGDASGRAIVPKVGPPSLIQEIVLGPDLPTGNLQCITDLIETYGLTNVIRR